MSKFQPFLKGCSSTPENPAPLKYNTNWSTYPIPKEPTKNCIFCKEFHWSHLCTEVASWDKRVELFQVFGLCLLCGKRNHLGGCSYENIFCKWPQCGAKNDHNTTLCPNVSYPVTEDIVKAYKDHVEYVWKLRESTMSSFNDTSQPNQRKDRKRNRKLSSNAKTISFGYHSNMQVT